MLQSFDLQGLGCVVWLEADALRIKPAAPDEWSCSRSPTP